MGHFELLDMGSELANISVLPLTALSGFPDLVLKGGSLILKPDGNFPDLSVHHTLPL